MGLHWDNLVARRSPLYWLRMDGDVGNSGSAEGTPAAAGGDFTSVGGAVRYNPNGGLDKDWDSQTYGPTIWMPTDTNFPADNFTFFVFLKPVAKSWEQIYSQAYGTTGGVAHGHTMSVKSDGKLVITPIGDATRDIGYVTFDAWNMIALVEDGGATHVYLDGVKQASWVTINSCAMGDSNRVWRLFFNRVSNFAYCGAMDEFTVIPTPSTDAQIAEFYRASQDKFLDLNRQRRLLAW